MEVIFDQNSVGYRVCHPMAPPRVVLHVDDLRADANVHRMLSRKRIRNGHEGVARNTRCCKIQLCRAARRDVASEEAKSAHWQRHRIVPRIVHCLWEIHNLILVVREKVRHTVVVHPGELDYVRQRVRRQVLHDVQIRVTKRVGPLEGRREVGERANERRRQQPSHHGA